MDAKQIFKFFFFQNLMDFQHHIEFSGNMNALVS